MCRKPIDNLSERIKITEVITLGGLKYAVRFVTYLTIHETKGIFKKSKSTSVRTEDSYLCEMQNGIIYWNGSRSAATLFQTEDQAKAAIEQLREQDFPLYDIEYEAVHD